MIRILWLLLGLAVVYGQRESGKAECDRNFNRNSFGEVSTLVPICHRGCDMYVVAFISTSLNQKADNLIRTNENLVKSHQTGNKMESNSIDSLKKKHTSKTTAEPIHQPVQDHPVKAGDQTTTMKIPNRDKSSVNSQKLINQIDGKQKKEVEEKQADKIRLKMRIEHATRTCRHACIIAYGEVADVEACVVGCHLQSKADQQKEPAKQAGKDVTSSLRDMESSMMKLVGNIGHYVRISWSWAFQKKQPEQPMHMEEYGSQSALKPQVVPLLLSGINVKSAFPKDQLKRKNMISPDVLHILQTFHNDLVLEPELFENINKPMNELQRKELVHKFHNPRSEHHYKSHHVGRHDQNVLSDGIKHYPKIPHGIDILHQQNEAHKGMESRKPPWMKSPEVRQSLDILECISRKSGLPRWFIAAAMFSSIPVALWLCFSLTSPPDEKVSKTKIVEAENVLEQDDIAEEKFKLLDYEDCGKTRFEVV